jgi:hypothetical protein
LIFLNAEDQRHDSNTEIQPAQDEGKPAEEDHLDDESIQDGSLSRSTTTNLETSFNKQYKLLALCASYNRVSLGIIPVRLHLFQGKANGKGKSRMCNTML